MHKLAIRSFVLLFGLCAILQALSIPTANPNSLSLHEETPPSISTHGQLETRGRARARPSRKKPTHKRPATKPSKKKPTHKRPKKPTRKPAPKHPKKPTKPGHRKPTPKHPKKPTKPGTKKPTPKRPTKPTKPGTKKPTKPGTKKPTTKPIKPLPFKPTPQSKKAFDVCTLPGFNCVVENDGRETSDKVKGRDLTGRDLSVLDKREPGDSRPFHVNFGTRSLSFSSKEYWTAPELFNNAVTGLNLVPVIADYAKPDARAPNAFRVKLTHNRLTGSTSTQKPGSSYVTEHIIELQSVARFIEAATGTRNRQDPHPVTLSKHVKPEWFLRHWTTHRANIAGRPTPARGLHPPQQADNSINDIVFEVLGSKANAQDFVLCESAINSAKMFLWKNQAPAEEAKMLKIATDASDGAIPSYQHMAALRTALGALDYMKVVMSKANNEIENVQRELSRENLEYLTNNDLPKDSDGGVIDLGALWNEYMDKQLHRYEVKAATWLETQLRHAIPLYQKELTVLSRAQKALTNEARMPAGNQKTTKTNRRVAKRNQLIKALPRKRYTLQRAQQAYDVENRKFEGLQRQLVGVPQAQLLARQHAIGWFPQIRARTTARNKLHEATRQVGLAERAIEKLDPQSLPHILQGHRADLVQLKSYRDKVNALKRKLDQQKLEQDMRWISL